MKKWISRIWLGIIGAIPALFILVAYSQNPQRTVELIVYIGTAFLVLFGTMTLIFFTLWALDNAELG